MSCKIFQRTVWDTDEQHRIWCVCGAVLTGDTAREVQAAWQEHWAHQGASKRHPERQYVICEIREVP